MPVAGVLRKRSKAGTLLEAVVDLTFFGTYPGAAGDPFDVTTIVGFTNRQPDVVNIGGKSGWLYTYDFVNKNIIIKGQQPTSATAGIIPLDDLANAAYPASITGDAVSLYCEWFATPKLP